MSNVLDRFLRYVKIDTQSSEESTTFPSTMKQKNLASLLRDELLEIGIENVIYDEENCYVYARIDANDDSRDRLAFIAHMDTSPEVSGLNVNPQIVRNYDGKDIVLNEEKGVILSPSEFKELNNYVGKSLVTTDGTTLLGADDKAGIAEIMTMAEELISNPDLKHGEIVIVFTPDEEVGAGVDKIDLEKVGADYAYTVDGGAIGELEYENFNAASANVVVKGVSVHPGDAKNKMKNALTMAMEFEMMLPKDEKPERTEGYEGFYHLTSMSGSIEEAKLSYIIRDHDMKKFEEKKELMYDIAKKLNEKYARDSFVVEINDSYYNMKEKIEDGYMFLIDRAKECMKAADIEPKVLPIRGGTDGARLSFMGLPCPNICTGGHNYHGRYEYVCIESMEKIVSLLVKLATY